MACGNADGTERKQKKSRTRKIISERQSRAGSILVLCVINESESSGWLKYENKQDKAFLDAGSFLRETILRDNFT